jgi:hypothetical protein
VNGNAPPVLLESIAWNGDVLTAIIATDGRRVTCSIERDAIHTLPMYNDAVEWEIERHKIDIFDRLKPMLASRLEGMTGSHLKIRAPDLLR